MDVSTLLDRLGATENVVAHVRSLEESEGRDVERIWAACRRADAAVWLAAQCGMRVPEIVAAVVSCARMAATDRATDGPIADALAAADAVLAGEDARAQCIEAADLCVEAADAMPSVTYRGGPDEGARAIAHAAEWAARAAEGLATAAARFWAIRAESARTTGALLGLPAGAVLGLAPPLRMSLDSGASEDPAQDELAFVLAAAAESAAHSAVALAAPATKGEPLDAAHEACVALLRRELARSA